MVELLSTDGRNVGSEIGLLLWQRAHQGDIMTLLKYGTIRAECMTVSTNV